MTQNRILTYAFTYLALFACMTFSVYAGNPELPVNLGLAGNFVILSESGISTTGTTAITGHMGVSPIDSTAITGFALIMDPSNQFSTSSLVSGNIYASDYTAPTPAMLTTAISDMQTAYTDAQGRTIPDAINLGAGDISGMTLTPGLYKWSTSVLVNTGGSPDANGVTLDCQGNASSVFIFQIAQDLTVGNGAQITLIGNCQAQNIFWAIAQDATLGTTSSFSGNILALNAGGAIDAIALNTGAALDGRALSQKAVTLIANAVSLPAGVIVQMPPTLVLATNATNDTLDATCTGNGYAPNSFDFDFGDGSPAILASPNNTATHIYAASGNYTVSCAGTQGALTLANTNNVTINIVNASVPSVLVQTVLTNATVDATCQATGYAPNIFDFDFGDGSPAILDIANNTATHTYIAAGTYTVYCAATENALTLANSTSVTINASNSIPVTSISVQTTVTNATVDATCQATGYSPNTFDFDFGDGSAPTYDITSNTLSHTYTASGNYTVSCAGTQGALTVMNSSGITISSSAAPPFNINLYVKNPFPQGNNYTFVCDVQGITPSDYDWEIVNLASGVREYLQYDILNGEIWHTMRQVGDYSVFCAATQGSTTFSDSITITNTFTPPVQTQPGNYANTTVTANTTTLVVPANANQDINIQVGLGITQTSIDLTALFLNTVGGTRAFMPINAIFDVATSAGQVNVQVPAGITISSTPAWNGILLLPQVTTPTATLPGNATAGAVIEMGSNLSLTFDKGVRILFAGRSAERVVYVKNGITTEITTVCAADTQQSADALAPGGECMIAVGSDLVVWTKHFTEFVTFTAPASPVTATPTSTGSSGGGSSGGGSHGGGGSSYFQATTPAAPVEPVVTTPVPNDAPAQNVNDATAQDNANSVQSAPSTDNAQQNSDAVSLTGLATDESSRTVSTALPMWLKFSTIGALIVAVIGSFYLRFRKH